MPAIRRVSEAAAQTGRTPHDPAAARTRLLDHNELLRWLARSLDALGIGSVDLPQRQRTLRDTVQWSMDLLDDNERSLLETMAIFVNGWAVDAAGQVAGLADDPEPPAKELR